MRSNGFSRAYSQITETKVSRFIFLISEDPDRERRVKMAFAALQMNYEKNMDYLKQNIICLPEITGSPSNREIYRKIMEIFRSATETPNWTDAEVILDAHEAGLIYKELIFVTADYNDILRHREKLLSITSLYDIAPLFET